MTPVKWIYSYMTSFLAEERLRLGLKQKDVFEKIGIGKSQFLRWEKGQAIPSDKLAALEELGFDIYYVVTGRRDRKNTVKVKYYSSEAVEKGIKAFMYEAEDMNWIDIPDETAYNHMVDFLSMHVRKAAGEDVEEGETEDTDVLSSLKGSA